MATGNHVPVRSRDEGGAWEVGATTWRMSDSVIKKIRGGPNGGHTATILHVYSKSPEISILNLKSQPKSHFRQIWLGLGFGL